MTTDSSQHSRPDHAVWHEMLEIARWTPSPHNTQPWNLRPLSATEAELYTVRARTLPDEDTTGCFIQCAMGMCVESMTIIASHRGLRLATRPLAGSESDGLIPFASLSLEPSEARDDLSAADIMERRTSRLPPFAAAVSEAHLASLATTVTGQRFTWTSNAGQVAAIMQANLDAVCHDLNDPRYHDEIAMWFRYGHSHALRTRDGLASTCMNMPAHELYCTAKMPWLLTSGLTGRLMRAIYMRRLGAVRQMGFVAGPFFDSPEVAANAGRALMRLWLRMHKLGIGIHPFGNLVTNKDAHRRLTDLTGQDNIWLAFRLGRTAPPPRSLRLDAEQLLC